MYLIGKTAYDIAVVKNQVECARLFATTFSDLPNFAPRLGWRKGQRSGKDISGGREAVPIPWVNDVDDEPFPRFVWYCSRCSREFFFFSSHHCFCRLPHWPTSSTTTS